jgi:hypothetical protein
MTSQKELKNNKKAAEEELKKMIEEPYKCEYSIAELCPKNILICGHWDSECGCRVEDRLHCRGSHDETQAWLDGKPRSNLMQDIQHCPHCKKDLILNDDSIIQKAAKWFLYQPRTGIKFDKFTEDEKERAENVLKNIEEEVGIGHIILQEVTVGGTGTDATAIEAQYRT